MPPTRVNSWLLPTAGFVVGTGLLGVTSKLALRSISWSELVLWTSIGYAAVALTILMAGGRLQLTSDTPWAIVSGALPALTLICLFVAIDRADASRVVPVSSVYPLVTALLAVAFLHERPSLNVFVGMVLVIVGVVVLTR